MIHYIGLPFVVISVAVLSKWLGMDDVSAGTAVAAGLYVLQARAKS